MNFNKRVFTLEERVKSFDYIESFISEMVEDWSKSPDTDAIEREFSKRIKQLDKIHFAFLLSHSGYIPEFYKHDSSQETLYSKLIESLVCEWANRIGFKQSILQKQKANKEDVTIICDDSIIVCDAKSFRLGRSQAAPNVKDTIKKSAYISWLDSYDEDKRVGGLVTFPSLHNWKIKSEAYKYFTENDPPIMLLFYEEMAFLLCYDYQASDILLFLSKYSEIYPKSSVYKDFYVQGLYDNLFISKKKEYMAFIEEFNIIIKSKVNHTIEKINELLESEMFIIKKEIESNSFEVTQKIAIDSLYKNKCEQMLRQKENIKKFRPCNIE